MIVEDWWGYSPSNLDLSKALNNSQNYYVKWKK